MRKFAIAIVEAGRTVEGRADQSVLDACLTAGVALRYNCRSGECGDCIARLASGEVRELPGADPALFNDDHRSRGLVLTCMSYPASDLVLSAPLGRDDAPAIVEFDTVVRDITGHGPQILEVSVETQAAVDYRAGQYFEWILPGISPNRTYSAANRAGTTRIEFHVRLYDQGQVSRFVASSLLGKGDILTLKGPFGNFRLLSDDRRPAILVAGGTGLAPISAMLDEAFASGSRRSFRFFYGARTASDLYHLERMAAWSRHHPGFSFIPVLSCEPGDSSWPGERGLVTETMSRRVSDAFGAEAYLCGPPPMIDAAIELLVRLGVDRPDIHYDKFTPIA
jgi:NAD(P)H-flavin reductase